MKKDKEKVIGEAFSEEKLALFLQFKPYDESDADFHILLKAYRGLPEEGFEQFLQLFKRHGRNINAQNHQNETFLDYISNNLNQQRYVLLMKEAGAVSASQLA